MPENGTSGTVRGVPVNRHSYRGVRRNMNNRQLELSVNGVINRQMSRLFPAMFILFVLLMQHSIGRADSREGLEDAFYQAVAEGNIQAVAKAITQGIDVNRVNEINNTPLMKAARHGYTGVVELLLKHKANISTRDIDGATPLIHAVHGGNTDVIKLLLAHGALVEEADSQGRTALFAACSEGNLEAVRLLLDRGANIEARDRQGNTPLLVSYQHRPVLELLLTRGANREATNSEGANLLMRAVWNKFRTHKKEFYKLLDDLRYILTQTRDVEQRDTKGNTALLTAYISHEIVELLLKAGASPNTRNYRGESALMLAACGNYFKTVETLLTHGADIGLSDNVGHTALWHARHCPAGDSPQMVMLLKDRGGLETGGDTGMEFACEMIESQLSLPLPGSTPVRSLLFLPGRFREVQVLLKNGGRCRPVLADEFDDKELSKHVLLRNGAVTDFPDLVFTETKYSATQGNREITRIYVWNGMAYERKGRREAAELNRQALALLANGELPMVLEKLNQAYDLVGGANVEMVNNLGFAYYKQWLKTKDQKSFDDAWRFLGEAIYLDRNRWQAQLNLADLFSQAGRRDEALEHYKKAIELNPGSSASAKIRKKMAVLQKRAERQVVLLEMREKVGKGLPEYSFKLYGDPDIKIAKRLVISDTTTKKLIQELSLENDDGEMESPPGDDFFSFTDINFDGYKDISLLVWWGATGNSNWSFWLFDPKTRKFAYSKDFEGLGTFTLDPKTRQILTHSNGGHAGMIHYDEIYEVRDNKPILIQRVDQDYDDKKGYYVEVTSKQINGSMKETSRKIIPAP